MFSGKVVVGIDLGTTNTCVCCANIIHGKKTYEVFENIYGKKTTPSVVTIKNDQVIIGEVAVTQAPNEPKNTVYGAKRLIGHKYNDEVLDKFLKNVPFDVGQDRDGYPIFNIPNDGKVDQYKPEQISAIVLEEVKRIIKIKTGKEPDQCVITVPAYFNDLQRASTKKAAEVAGLNVLNLINEPTAAAIAFQHQCNYDNGTFLVFDFGGGTLDVSILNVEGNKFTVRAVAGDTSLGGEDIDILMMEEMISRFEKKHRLKDIKISPRSRALLRGACEKAKINLSSAKETDIVLPNFFEGKDLIEKISLSEFDYIIGGIVDKVTDPIGEALLEAGLEEVDITHVIMVGGSSRILSVIDAVQSYFSEEFKLLSAVSPDEAIAIGAAIVCDKMSQGLAYQDITGIIRKEKSKAKSDEETDDDDGMIVIVDVQPISIGVKSGDNGYKAFIKRNQPLPQSATFKFATMKDNQAKAIVEIYQGESEKANENIFINKFVLTGIPRGHAGSALLTLQMSVGNDGILKVSATCDANNISKKCKIDFKSRLEGKDMKDAVEKHIKMAETRDAMENYLAQLCEFQKLIYGLKDESQIKAYQKIYTTLSENIPESREKIIEASNTLDGIIQKLKGR